MLRGIYTAASGMMGVQLATDTLANNIANVSTTGYKSRRVDFQAFGDMMIHRLEPQKATAIGNVNTGIEIASTPVYFGQGSLRQTGNPLDVAIEGDSLLAVKTEQGQVAYTRNGALTLNRNRELTTTEGYAVLDTNGQAIQFPEQPGEIQINQDGAITLKNTGQELATLQRVRFANPSGLHKLNDSLFIGDQPLAVGKGEGGTVQQGFLEQSNTNVVSELLQTMTGLRLYEALQKSMTTQNQTLGKAVNDLAHT
jgi:flagellar basal body rod protein FlgG